MSKAVLSAIEVNADRPSTALTVEAVLRCTHMCTCVNVLHARAEQR